MYIEGTQSSKQLFVGTSDGVKLHSIANSVGASSLNNEDEDSKGSEAVTKKLASAVNITDDTQKDRQVLESSVEGSSISETPVSFTTDENGSYDTSEKDKSASNISSNNVCFQSNLHGASMTGKSQGSSDGISMYLSIEKLESPSKQKCSDKMVSVLIYALCIKEARLLLLILIAIPIFTPVGFGDYKDSFRCTSKDCSLCAHKPS